MMRFFNWKSIGVFDEISIPIEVSDDPMTVVAKGTAIVAAEPLALEPEVRLRAMK